MRRLIYFPISNFKSATTSVIAQLDPRVISTYPVGEAHYFLGLTLVFKGENEADYSLFYKATWNQAWRAAAFYQLACLECRKSDFDTALRHLAQPVAPCAVPNPLYRSAMRPTYWHG